MKEYKCIKKLIVHELDEPDGEMTGKDFVVEAGEIWIDESGLDEFSGHLSDYDGRWLQIELDTLEEHFEALEESE